MAIRPTRYPLHDVNNTNSAVLPDAFTSDGYPPNSIADALSANAKLGSNGQWVKFNDFTIIRADLIANEATARRLSSNGLTYPLAAGLGPHSPIVSGYPATYMLRANVITFDSPFCVDAGLEPITFQASKRTWIYCSSDGVVRVDIVPLATAATPAFNEFVVIAVDTDATNITAIVTTSSPLYELHYSGPVFQFDSLLRAVEINTNRLEADETELGPASGVNPTLTVNSAAAGVITADIVGNGTAPALAVAGGSHFAISATATGNSRPCISASHSGTTPALYGRNTSGVTGDGVYGQSDAVGGAGVRGVSGNIVEAGVLGESAALASAVAVEGDAKHPGAFGVVGRLDAAATSSSTAVLGLGSADGEGVRGFGVNGYGVVAQSDQTSPNRAAMRVVPQNADPLVPAAGDVRNASERGGKFRIRTNTQHESLHSSAKGMAFGYATAVNGSSISTTGDILDVTITAEELGVVELLVMGALASGADTTTTTVLFRDITNAVDVTSQAYAAYDSDGGAAATRMMPFSWRRYYTLVTTTTLFRVRFNFSALVHWYDLTFTVRGTF